MTDYRLKLLEKARRYARAQFNKLRQSPEYCYAHNSHSAAKALELTEKKFGSTELGTFGIEGFATGIREGISYLNTGDLYDLTIIFKSESNRFAIASIGDILERGSL